MNEAGIKFLDKLYANLYMSDVVQHTKDNKDNRYEAIGKYLDRLERIHSKADTESKKNHLKRLYFDKYVIKKENIPNGLDSTQIINSQQKRLSMWIDYLSDPNTVYPMWAKYWAFQGMLKMGSYDDIKGIYLTRNKKTIAPFIEPNPEIIAKSIETIMKLVNNEEISEDIEERLSKTDSFSKIYTTFEKKWKSTITNKADSNDGIWIKYNQGSKADAIKLSKSLENKNTGWCTTSENMAIKQLCGSYDDDAPNGGDFYVYYTKDEHGKYIMPRIAIRLINHDRIGEIRGILEGQNVEESMTKVLEQKLLSMNNISQEDIDKNLKIIEDLRELTLIGIKTERNEKLTDQELDNLYTKEYGFGFANDPKVDKIIEKRNYESDYARLNRDIKIALLVDEIMPETFKEDDRDIILEVVKRSGWAFIYASDRLKDDKDMILEALKYSSYGYEFASKRLRNDKEVILAAIKRYPLLRIPFLENLLDDKDIVLAKVSRDGIFIRNVSDRLKDDKDVVLAALRNNPFAFVYASERLQKDKELKKIYDDAEKEINKLNKERERKQKMKKK